MRVLIVSHNPMGGNSNMGKTLQSYFLEFPSGDLAQFYIHPEDVPGDSICPNCFRFTDGDAIRSLIPFLGLRKRSGLTGAVYQYGRRRTAGIYLCRNLLWKCCRWNRKEFRDWVDEFSPEIVFLASGDYGFLYEIAVKIADRKRIPLVVSCMDDYYLYNRNEGSFLGRIVHRSFLKTVRKTIDRAGGIFTICPAMQKAYEVLFGKKCDVLYTPARKLENVENQARRGIAYIGNLGYDRDRQLVRIGRALQALQIPGGAKYLDVYSQEQDPVRLKHLTPENGIRFHGSISSGQVHTVMANSMALIHTESFDEKMRNMVRFSVSTKIPESLMNGPCLIAYGPKEIASIDYLAEHGAAYVITEPSRLEDGLKEILTNASLRERIITRARALAQTNHNMQVNPALVKRRLREVCEAWEKEHEGITG